MNIICKSFFTLLTKNMGFGVSLRTHFFMAKTHSGVTKQYSIPQISCISIYHTFVSALMAEDIFWDKLVHFWNTKEKSDVNSDLTRTKPHF